MHRRLLLFGLIAALAVVLGFWTFPPAQAVRVVMWGGYWFVLAAVVAFGFTLVRSLADTRAEWRDWRRWWRPGLVLLAGTIFLHVHESHDLKIVADEVVQQLTARELHFSRRADVVIRGYEYAGAFTPMGTFIDKRPLLFPFTLATVHDLTGYRPGNVYVLNAVLSGVFLLLIALVARRLHGWGAGIAAVLLVATIPLVAQNACAGGFEMLNLVMIVLTLWLGMRAAERPGDDDRLGAFALSGVLLAQTRYESALFILPVGATILYLWWRQRQPRLPWPILVAPLLLVICPLHLNVFKVAAGYWQLSDIANADAPFALRYFYDNVGHALAFFLSTDGTQPNSLLVAVAGVLGVGFFCLLLVRDRRRIFGMNPVEAAFDIFLLGLVLHTGLMLCYFWGHWDEPVIRRLSLPVHVLLVLALVYCWPHLVHTARRWVLLATISLVFLASVTVPHVAVHRYTQDVYAARVTNWLTGHIRALGDRTALAIDRSSGLNWFLYGKSSIAEQAVVDRPDAFIKHFRNRSFAEYFVVQRASPIFPTGRRILDETADFGDALKLELVEERAFAPLYLVRLSRIVDLDEAKLRAWAKDRREHPVAPPATFSRLSPLEEEILGEWLRQLP